MQKGALAITVGLSARGRCSTRQYMYQKNGVRKFFAHGIGVKGYNVCSTVFLFFVFYVLSFICSVPLFRAPTLCAQILFVWAHSLFTLRAQKVNLFAVFLVSLCLLVLTACSEF